MRLRNLNIAVFHPGASQPIRYRQHAEAGYFYTEDNVGKFLSGIAGELRAKYPDREYKRVTVGSGRWNFVGKDLPDSLPRNAPGA